MVKLVYCLTTIPRRLPLLEKTVRSILEQKIPFDLVYITLPKTSKKGAFLDKDVENFTSFVKAQPNSQIVKVLRPELDHGPIMKVHEVLAQEDKESFLLIGDDDRLISKEAGQYWRREAERLKEDEAASLSGWNVGSFPFSYQYVSVLEHYQYVDWIEGTNGILVRGKHLDRQALLNYSGEDPLFKKHDDHWLAYHLHKKGIKRKVTPFKPLYSNSGAQNTDAISQSPNFFSEVCRLGSILKEKGVYFRSGSKEKSLVFLFILYLLLLLLIGYGFWKKTPWLPLALLLLGILLFHFLKTLQNII